MSTNLFSKYYDNPRKQYVYTNMQCGGASADEINFSISGDCATISTNSDTLSKLCLDGIKEYVTEWKNETRVIEPYSFIYVKGITEGLAYQSVSFGVFDGGFDKTDAWDQGVTITFNIKYWRNGCAQSACIHGVGNYDEERSAISEVQNELDKRSIPVTVSYSEGVFTFTSGVAGYPFYISTDYRYNTINIKSNDYFEIEVPFDVYLYEIEDMYVPAKKYTNGAFRGVVVVPEYPEFNSESLDPYQFSLKICHIRNRIDAYRPVRVNPSVVLWDKFTKDVDDSYNDAAEMDKFKCRDYLANAWHNPSMWVLPDDPPEPDNMWDTSKVGGPDLRGAKENFTGIYGFVNWALATDNWINVGPLYSTVTAADPADVAHRNLVGGFVVYNPNPFPIKVGYMCFV